MFEFVFTQMTKANTQSCNNFGILYVVFITKSFRGNYRK